jgi:hypothetical protein
MKILFRPYYGNLIDLLVEPVPAVKALPDWWKTMPKYAKTPNNYPAVTVKACAPTLDAMSTGYIVKLWSDLLVEDGKVIASATARTNYEAVSQWNPEQVSHFEIPDGFTKAVYKYQHGWSIQTPKGYSCLFTQPYAYTSSVTQVISGIIDTDILKTDANTPFMIREGFNGIIKRGTPMFQVIPFKREEWHAVIKDGYAEEFDTAQKQMSTKFFGYYSARRERKRFS